MSKALALFCSGLVRAPQLPEARQRATTLAAQLRQGVVSGAWGYEFDVQTRWAYYPAGSPNIIATSFVIEAGHDLGDPIWSDETRAWFERRMVQPDGYIRYVPDSDRLIHNASMLGARALHRIAPGHPAVAAAVETTLASQRPDGLWAYGAGAGLGWVDNFHTAYVLTALADLPDPTGSVAPALARGVAAWLNRCFERDGTPRYYADRPGPTDVHNLATSVYALARLARVDPACRQLLPGACAALLRHQRADGAFVATPRGPAYMRWNQGHAYLALASVAADTSASDR